MTSFEKAFDINFSSLKAGIHEFSYVINDAFFDQTELEVEFINSNINIEVRLEKSETMMTLYFDLEGKAEMPCGRCLDNMEFEIEGNYTQIIKFGDETYNVDDIIVLSPSEYKINIGSLIYEFSILTMLNNVFHEDEEDCNQEYLESIADYLLTEIEDGDDIDKENKENEIDPRWNQLKNLKNKNK